MASAAAWAIFMAFPRTVFGLRQANHLRGRASAVCWAPNLLPPWVGGGGGKTKHPVGRPVSAVPPRPPRGLARARPAYIHHRRCDRSHTGSSTTSAILASAYRHLPRGK